MSGRPLMISSRELHYLRRKLAGNEVLLARERFWLNHFIGHTALAFPGWFETWLTDPPPRPRDRAPDQKEVEEPLEP